MYYVCWIRNLGIKINVLIIDTMIASSLIDENRFSYTLNTLSWHHLSEGKNEARLNQAAKERGPAQTRLYRAKPAAPRRHHSRS